MNNRAVRGASKHAERHCINALCDTTKPPFQATELHRVYDGSQYLSIGVSSGLYRVSRTILLQVVTRVWCKHLPAVELAFYDIYPVGVLG